MDKYRKETERSLDPFISVSIKQHRLPWSTPFKFTATDQSFKVSDLGGSPFTLEPNKLGGPGYFKVWYGRSLVVIAEKPDAPFTSAEYKGGFMEYVTKHNSSLQAHAVVQLYAEIMN